MANMMKMMKQVQEMQANMAKAQEELAEQEVEFSAGGGMVTATATCDGNLQGLKIDPKVIDPEDAEMLEDLIVAAVDGAIRAAKKTSEEKMSGLTKGLNLPPGMGF